MNTKILTLLFVLIACLEIYSDGVGYYSDQDITSNSSLILDAVVTQVNIQSQRYETNQNGERIHEVVYEYLIHVDEVIRGDKSKGELIKLKEVVYSQGAKGDGSLVIGDTFRFFNDFGSYKNGEFILNDPFASSDEDYYYSPNNVRPELYRSQSTMSKGSHSGEVLRNKTLGNESRLLSEQSGENFSLFTVGLILIALLGLVLGIQKLFRS